MTLGRILPSLLLLSACGGASHTAGPQLRAGDPEVTHVQTDDPIANAILTRLTIWVSRDGDVVYPRHCRDAPGGCEARISTLSTLVEEAAGRHGIDPWLLAALAVRESMFNPGAIGARGEAGIVQLHPRGAGHDVRYVQDATYREACQERVDACQGPVVDRGAQHLADAIRACGGERDGLGKYASGRCGAAGDYVDRLWAERDRLRASH